MSETAKRGQRIRYIRKDLLNLSRSDLCKTFAFSPQSLKAWELGWGGGLNEERAKDLTNHLKTLGIYATPAWLMHGIGNPPSPLTSDSFISEEDDDHIAKELLIFREQSNTIDVIVDNNSMAPFLNTGDYAGGIFVSHPTLAIKQLCILIDNNDKNYIKILEKGDKENFYHLTGFNNDSSENEKIKNVAIKLAAPILWIRKRKRHTPTHLDPW